MAARAVPWPRGASFFAACGCSSAPAAGGGSQGSHATSGDVRALDVRLETIRERLDLLSANDWAFWKTHGPDREHGGFHGTLDRKGQPVAPTDKGFIQ